MEQPPRRLRLQEPAVLWGGLLLCLRDAAMLIGELSTRIAVSGEVAPARAVATLSARMYPAITPSVSRSARERGADAVGKSVVTVAMCLLCPWLVVLYNICGGCLRNYSGGTLRIQVTGFV